MSQDIVQIKLSIDIPQDKWLATFNNKYPELNFHILSNFLIEENSGITSFQIRGSSVKQFISDFKDSLAKKSSQILFEGEDLVILNVKEVDPWILNILVKTELLISYPVLVKDGKIRMEAITNRSKVDRFLTQLEKKDIKAKIEHIGYYYKSTLLTKRQNEIVNLAYQNGFFNIPRSISLSEFAKDLNISKSALSETMRRIFKKLAKNYLNSSN
ncbi:MAG: helix-turn-helix domain-containing protein [Candidatus Lokiarchaeota archaeon]|nr:helix-turn-helix domain-containing protein [Candidatus Lokiarchaeota archaeon]